MIDLEQFEKNIKYQFKDKMLLKTALTHSSYANENANTKDNERLEFLGDSVLSLVVSSYIFKYKSLKEGDLTKIRSLSVCEDTLYEASKKINLENFILLGNGEAKNNGNKRPSILSDTFEAIIGAMYLDGGFEKVQEYILFLLKDTINKSINLQNKDDYKSRLQEEIQKVKGNVLKYAIDAEKGPEHNKLFKVKALLNNKIIGIGIGKSKKDAEMEAAKNALEKYY